MQWAMHSVLRWAMHSVQRWDPLWAKQTATLLETPSELS